MKTLCGFLLFSVLVLWVVLPPASLEGTTVRPGRCPPFSKIGCVEPQQDRCKVDAKCPWPKKCCYQPCSLRCVDPIKRID
ncbi:omwaprin-a [Anolis carolinensis]|uniref:omwaprin-a n=1 Tax=Anolis carolinensis TaxID=28377 RepID=UPI000462E347|nr:PREDICTED: omwaprin-a [Anolis carolinensis]|eukprot:XP_008108288.1 PREDICTED: omwaprin-a [Anolis carolinensis]